MARGMGPFGRGKGDGVVERGAVDSREQKVIYGFAGQEGNNTDDFQMVCEDRVIIAYPGKYVWSAYVYLGNARTSRDNL